MLFYDLIIKNTHWNDNVIQGSSGKHCSLGTGQFRIHWFLHQIKVKMALKSRGLTNPGKISLLEIMENQEAS